MFARRGSSCSVQTATLRQGSASSASCVSSNESDLQRLAINALAVLGSFYDATTDDIPASLALEKTPISKRRIGKIMQCQCVRSDAFERESFLHEMGINDDLWLHVLLRLEPVHRMASIATYSFPASDNIRFFYYYYLHEENHISNERNTVMSHVRKITPIHTATHIVSELKFGIQVFVVLELPRDNTAEFDLILEQWFAKLSDKNQPTLEKKYEKWLDRIMIRKVFSNVPVLETMRSLEQICQTIVNMQKTIVVHPLMAYNLRPIKWFYPSYPSNKGTYTPLEQQNATDLRKYVLRMSSDVGELERLFESDVTKASERHFEQRLIEIKTMHSAEMYRVRELTLNFHRGKREAGSALNLGPDSPGSILRRQINQLVTDFSRQITCVSDMSSSPTIAPNAPPTPASATQQAPSARNSREPVKTSGSPLESTSTTNRQGRRNQPDSPSGVQSEILPTYQTAATKVPTIVNSASHCIPSTIDNAVSQKEHNLSLQVLENVRPPSRPPSPHRNNRISPVTIPLSRSMSLERREKIDVEKPPDSPLQTTLAATRPRSGSRNRSTAESKTPSQLSPSHTGSPPKALEQHIGQSGPILPPSTEASSATKHKIEAPIRQEQAEKSPPPKRQRSDQPPVTYTNVLLLGESGVGKSTFINALVNYLAFDSLDRARTSPPLVVMPVSFLLAVGHDFEEKIVKFGDEDANEDHHHPGQSVTQQCRSYIFTYNTERPLRIIDTPGMGDTRGLDQDDRNMQHIISYINHLPHLDAICILLKPNESRLNVVLRSYFTRLITFLGPEAGQNIIFCFTSCRSTFFAPGNTGPLLRAMITQLPTKTITFGKPNTFCFDSESFRYLMALQNQVKFDACEEQEYQKSWRASTTESHRFLQCICQSRKPYSQDKWRSIEHFQFTLHQMARPLLESIRHLYRNIIILGKQSSQYYLKLRSKSLPQVSTICYRCERTPQVMLDVWILPDLCEQCACDRKYRMDIYYQIEIKGATDKDRSLVKNFVSDVDRLETTVVTLAQLQASLSGNDPLSSYLKRMIAEEDFICTEKGSACLNTMVRDKLVALGQRYQEKRHIGKSKSVPIDLDLAYQQIHDALKISLVDQQMQSVRETFNTVMKQYEKRVEYNRTENY